MLSINKNAMKKNRSWKGVWIPEEIYLSSLKWPEKILWLEIDYLSENGINGCFASNSYFAKFLDISEASVTRYISHLKELNLIEEIGTDGRRRFLKTNHEPFQELKTCLIKLTRLPNQIDEADPSNCCANNKEINNIDLNISKEIYSGSFQEPKEVSSFDLKKDKLKQSIQQDKLLKKDKIKKTTNKNIPVNRQIRFIQTYIDSIWNDKDLITTKHRKDSKTYNNIVSMMNQLLEGRFTAVNKLNQEWVDKNIDPELLNKKWTTSMLKEALEHTVKYTINGYWPPNKKNVLNLSNLIFNPRTGTSLFLKAMSDPPVPTSEMEVVDDGKYSDDLHISTNQRKLIKEVQPIKAVNKRKLENTLVELRKWHIDIQSKLKFGDSSLKLFNNYIEKYAEFIYGWREFITLEYIGPGTKVHSKFMEKLREDEDIY